MYRVKQFLNLTPLEFPCLTEKRKNMLIHENLRGKCWEILRILK